MLFGLFWGTCFCHEMAIYQLKNRKVVYVILVGFKNKMAVIKLMGWNQAKTKEKSCKVWKKGSLRKNRAIMSHKGLISGSFKVKKAFVNLSSFKTSLSSSLFFYVKMTSSGTSFHLS